MNEIKVGVAIDSDELRETATRLADRGDHGPAHVLYAVAKAVESGELPEWMRQRVEEPEPGPDLSLIPSSREEARPVEVNGVVVTCYRDDGWLWSFAAEGGVWKEITLDDVTSVREVRILADDQVAVDAEIWRKFAKRDIEVDALVERAQAWDAWYEDRATATVKPENGVEILRDLAAVDRGEGR